MCNPVKYGMVSINRLKNTFKHFHYLNRTQNIFKGERKRQNNRMKNFSRKLIKIPTQRKKVGLKNMF